MYGPGPWQAEKPRRLYSMAHLLSALCCGTQVSVTSFKAKLNMVQPWFVEELTLINP